MDLPDEVLAIAPHDALQILHIGQEALTNVLKHARAQTVTVQLGHHDGTLTLHITDDGHSGSGPAPVSSGGRGQANMRARAQRLGGSLDIGLGNAGSSVSLRVPLSGIGTAGTAA